MKKLSILFLFISSVAFGQQAFRTLSGTGYVYYPSETKTTRAVIYLHGSGEVGSGSDSDLNKVRNQGLCWYVGQGNKIPFHVFAPQQAVGKSGYSDGLVLKFINDIRKQYGITDFLLTGFSMGADGSAWTAANDTTGLIRGIVCVAPTNTGYQTAVKLGKKKMPVLIYWGANDSWKNSGRTIPYTQFPTGYKDGSGIKLEPTVFPTGGHDSGTWKQVYTNLNLYTWMASLCLPEISGIKDPVKSSYFYSDGFLYVELESGKVRKFKPSD